jgi:isopentenyl-diphosphate delta-isomerase
MAKMEHHDVINEQDEVIGVASRRDIYDKKLLHRICNVLVFNKRGDLLLQKRAAGVSYLPGHWSTSVGGHVISGESAKEAAMREMKEEVGVSAKIEYLDKYIFEVLDQPGLKKMLFVYKATHNGPFKENPQEVSETKFCRASEIKKMIKRGDKFHPELISILEKFIFVK